LSYTSNVSPNTTHDVDDPRAQTYTNNPSLYSLVGTVESQPELDQSSGQSQVQSVGQGVQAIVPHDYGP